MAIKDIDKRVVIGAGAVLGVVAVGGAVAVASRVVQIVRTKAGSARVKTLRLSDGNKIRVLVSGDVYQSATYLGKRWAEPVFAYYRAFDAMFDAEPAMLDARTHGIDHVLMLGGGGYSYPKHALTTRAGLTMDVVEIDPAVTRAARRWFYLDRLEQEAGRRLHIFTDDGRNYLKRIAASTCRYDVVLNDCFCGNEPVYELATVEALSDVRTCLNPGGMYLANIVSREEGADVSFLRDAVASALKVFRYAWVIEASDEEWGGESNYLLIASDDAYSFTNHIPFDKDFAASPMFDRKGLFGRSSRR